MEDEKKEKFFWLRRRFKKPHRQKGAPHPGAAGPAPSGPGEKDGMREALATGITVWAVTATLWKAVLAIKAVLGTLRLMSWFWTWWSRQHPNVPVLKNFSRSTALMIALTPMLPVTYWMGPPVSRTVSAIYDAVVVAMTGQPPGTREPAGPGERAPAGKRDCKTHPMDCT